jgi:hypothetical protein
MSIKQSNRKLFAKLESMGFTYDEAASLRRIEMTLQRWAERECGDGSDWAIQRDEVTGKPFNVYHGESSPRKYAIPDREAGALKRAKNIVSARNVRINGDHDRDDDLMAYHQGDCRGCMLYLIPAGTMNPDSNYSNGFPVCSVSGGFGGFVGRG